LMGGDDFFFSTLSRAVMMVSHDAINWTTVYYSEDTGRDLIWNIVWDAAEGAFYAVFIGPAADGVSTPSPTGLCLRSETGYVWEEVADDFWSHAEDGKMPDGRAGHDPESGLTIMPGDVSVDATIYCTAYANGVWMAGGENVSGSVTYISLDGGVNWLVSTSGVVGSPNN